METPFQIFSKSIAATLGSCARKASIDQNKKLFLVKKVEMILKKMLSKAKVDKLMKKYHAIFNPKYAMYIGFVFELVLLIYDWYKTCNSNISQEQFMEVMVERICAAICSIPGFWLGYYLGGMLSVAICGWALPAVLVSIVVGASCDFLAKEVGGKLGDQVVLPLVKRLWLEAKMKSE